MKRVHQVCDYLLRWKGERGCNECPAWVQLPHHGGGQPLCYGIAEEVISVVRTGGPHGIPRTRTKSKPPAK